MLVPIPRAEEHQVLARWPGGFGRRLLLRKFLERYDPGTPRPRLLADNVERPRLFVAVHGARLCVQGARQEVRRWLRQLADDPRHTIPRWPDRYTRQSWEQSEDGQPCVRFTQTYGSHLEEARRAGLVPRQADLAGHQPHYLYWLTGRPRCAPFVRHSVRQGEGQELHRLLVTGIPYDETGEYTRQCLAAGPSFVCEVDGQPVSWSCTHLGGAIGMIFTPAEQRGRGYATSLTACHIDHLLARDGLAFAFVRWNNDHSRRMFAKLGARHTREPLSWCTFYWPAGIALR